MIRTTGYAAISSRFTAKRTTQLTCERDGSMSRHRFNKNASEHTLENSVVSTQAMYTRPQIATMLYAIFSLIHSLMRQQDRLGMIREIEVELLFVYGRDA